MHRNRWKPYLACHQIKCDLADGKLDLCQSY